MPADTSRSYDTTVPRDVPAQIRKAHANAVTRSRRHLERGDALRAARALAAGAKTVEQWADGTHPALPSSA